MLLCPRCTRELATERGRHGNVFACGPCGGIAATTVGSQAIFAGGFDGAATVFATVDLYDDATGQWFRTHGNEHWEFDESGLMRRRDMSANDVPIAEQQRRLR